LATSTTPTSGSWLTIDLPANAVNTTGNTSLALKYTTSGANTQLNSREDASHKPELTINTVSTLNTSADTYVDSNHTSSNYGSTNPLWATLSSTRAFLRFGTNDVVPTGNVVTSAKLKIYVTNNSVTSGGFEVHPEPDTWTETGTTWSNQPTWSSTVLATSGTPTSGSWLTIDLPVSAINTAGNTSLALKYTTSGANTQLNSREDSTHKPELSLTYSSFTSTDDSYYVSPVLAYEDTAAPSAPTKLTPLVGPNNVTLTWNQSLDTQDDAVTQASVYTVYRDDEEIGTAGSDVTAFNDEGLSTGTYNYTVTAKDYCGNTSNESLATPATVNDEMLFSSNSAPSSSVSTSTDPVTVGVQFTSDVEGEVQGVRFYRAEELGEGATIGVWDDEENLLGSGTVADTDGTGWIIALFQEPVTVQADTTYTVGYYSPGGQYSYTAQGLYTPISNGNLTAPAEGGVYHTGTGMVLPASTSSASNYWVTPIVGQKRVSGVEVGDLVLQKSQNNFTETRLVLRQADGAEVTLDPTDSAGAYPYPSADSPDVAPNGQSIVFTHVYLYYDENNVVRGGNAIAVMNTDGSGKTRITNPDAGSSNPADRYSDSDPRWSPDGTKIVFSRLVYDPSLSEWIRGIYSMDADGSNVTALTTGSVYVGYPVWSPDGSKIAFIHDTSSNVLLWLMNADGSNQHAIDPGTTCGDSNDAAWAPGNRLYFLRTCVGSQKISYFTSTDGFATAANSTEHEVVDRGLDTVANLRLSGDGATAYYLGSADEGFGNVALDIRDNEERTETQLTHNIEGVAYGLAAPVNASWSMKHFAVLGDSYSAGEGNPPFIPPSDHNDCHRSFNAYANFLAGSASGLRLTNNGFVACAGATTTDAIEGWHKEPSQLPAITSNDDYVILTIGGNDVDFPDFAGACAIVGCASGSSAYSTIVGKIQNILPGALADFFEDIGPTVGTKRVLVLGYPNLLPAATQPFNLFSCSWLTPSSQDGAKQVEDYLNAAISEAVTLAGGPFEFVDANDSTSPFAGHELCTNNSYFNNVKPPPHPEYSYHPNVSGQAAYAKLVQSYLASHP